MQVSEVAAVEQDVGRSGLAVMQCGSKLGGDRAVRLLDDEVVQLLRQVAGECLGQALGVSF